MIAIAPSLSRGALSLLLDQLQDVKEAVDFVEEVMDVPFRPHVWRDLVGCVPVQLDDEKLWRAMVAKCVTSPYLTGQLLQHCALPNHVSPSAVDPRIVVASIPPTMDIPGLKQRLVDILKDQSLRLDLVKSCASVLKADCGELLVRLHKCVRRGIAVDPVDKKCPLCNDALHAPPSSRGAPTGLSVFFCGHAFHQGCLLRRIRKTESSRTCLLLFRFRLCLCAVCD